MGRYAVFERIEAGERVVDLNDQETRSSASIVPGIGAQCRRYTWWHGEGPLDILLPAEELSALRDDPVYYGNPILFPFPNRIKGGKFRFDGKEVALPVNETGRNNAIHGLVVNRPWRVRESGAADSEGAWVTCAIASTDEPSLAQSYPFAFELAYTYRLRNGALESEIVATNVGNGPMPMGFGLHPWFPSPLSPSSAREMCRLRAPVTDLWELEELIPTGEIVRAAGERDLSSGLTLGDLTFDDVYTGLSGGGWSESVYADPGAGVEIAVISDSAFRELVVYAPFDRGVVCLEPYTCTTDAFNLQARGIDAGVIVLQPGTSWTGYVKYVPRITAEAYGYGETGEGAEISEG